MRRLGLTLSLFLALFFLGSAGRVLAADINVSATGLTLSGSNGSLDSQAGAWKSTPIDTDDLLLSVDMEWHLQEGDSWGFIYYQYDDPSGAVQGVHEIGRSQAVPMVTANLIGASNFTWESGSWNGYQIHGVGIYLVSGSSEGNRYVAFDKAYWTKNTLIYAPYPVPDFSSSAPSSASGGSAVFNFNLNWGSPLVPSGESAPILMPRSPIAYLFENPSVSSLNHPGNVSVSAVVDDSSPGEIVAVPSYDMPAPVESPTALPSMPLPDSALPPREEPIVPTVPLMVSVPMNSQSPLMKQDTLQQDGFYQVEPVLQRQEMSIQIWQRDPVPERSPIPE